MEKRAKQAKKNIRTFIPYLRPYRKRIAVGLLLMTGVLACGLMVPLLLKWAIDTVEGHSAGTAVDYYTGQVESDLALYAGAIALLAAVQWLLSIGMRWLFGAMSRWVERDLRQEYSRHLLRLPLAFFQGQQVGDLVARATNDTEAIQRFLYFGFRMGLYGVLTFVLSLGLMCSIDWALALWALLPMPAMVLITRWVGGKVHRGYRRVQEQFGAISSRIQENLAGMRVVKAYDLGADEAKAFAGLNQDYVDKNRRLVKMRSLFFPFTFLLNGVSMVVILWMGGVRVIEGQLTLGDFVAFNAYLLRLGFPMMLLGWIVDEYQRATASWGRIEEILAAAPQADQPRLGMGPLAGQIEFRQARFAYNGQPALEAIDIKVPAGGTLAVVGRVGSGKTTLARLVPLLLEAEPGQVFIDGIPIEELPLETLRAAIGYVPQDTFLFSDSLRENIALGQADEVVQRAVEVAQLQEDVAAFPQGLDTVVGERGVTLSGGQKQRAALARALVRDPKILVLDDALASVDTHTEEKILQGLRQLMAQRTTIIIAHRISTVKGADHIVVLDQGRIAEQGTHEQLLAQKGIYADMYRRQDLSEELSAL